MADYYTTEYSPSSNRYQNPAVQIDPQALAQRQAAAVAAQQQAPVQVQPQVQVPASQYTYNSNSFNLNFKEILKKAIKYLVEGLAVAFVAYYFIGKGKLNIQDIVLLGITAAFVFAILDTFSPTIALGARFGAGFGIGQGLFGVGPGLIAGPIRPL